MNLKKQLSFLVILLISLGGLNLSLLAKSKNTKVLVVRGGHPYDTPAFEKMCLKLKGIDADLVLTAHFESKKPDAIAEEYDAILFLNQNKHYPEYERNKKKYMELTQLGVGMVFLHFTLSSQPTWDEYHELIGGKWFLKSHTKDEKLLSTYYPEKTVDIKVVDDEHPVTAGMKDFSLNDTFYGNIYMAAGVKPLLTCQDAQVWETIAWEHKYNNSKVVYIMPGYSKKAFENSSYQQLVRNALQFVGSK